MYSDLQDQKLLYAQQVQPLVEGFMQGRNSTVFLFGPSGSGKTFLLHGKSATSKGILNKTID